MFNINKAEKIVAIKSISFGKDLYLKRDKVIKIILVTQKGLVTPESLFLVGQCPESPLPRDVMPLAPENPPCPAFPSKLPS